MSTVNAAQFDHGAASEMTLDTLHGMADNPPRTSGEIRKASCALREHGMISDADLERQLRRLASAQVRDAQTWLAAKASNPPGIYPRPGARKSLLAAPAV